MQPGLPVPVPAPRPDRPEAARRVVLQHVLAGAGIGLVPVPLVGFGGGLAVDALMLARLARLYGQRLERSHAQAWLAALASSVGASVVGGGIGGFFGRVALPASIAGFSYALGKMFVDHLECGGRVDDFDPLHDVEAFRRLSRRGGRFLQGLVRGVEPLRGT